MGLLRSCSRQPLIAVLVAAGFVVAACGGGGHTSAGSPAATSGGTLPSPLATAKYRPARATVIGKSTHVVVNPALVAALKQAGITVTAVAPATAKTTLHFPVTGGQIVVPTLAGTVDHTGGLTFSHSGKSVALSNLVINTKTKQLTATVSGQSMPIFALNLTPPKRPRSPHGTLVESDIKLTVTPQATTALNSGLGMSTFKAGMNFGVATLTVAYARGHR